MHSPLKRLAWIGDAGEGGGVPGLCRLFLQELARMEIQVDWYARMPPAEVAKFSFAQDHPRFRSLTFPYEWNWDTWYGRNPKLAFLVSFLKRLRANRGLVRRLVAEHRRQPYEAVLQFSQGELLGLKAFAGELPIILYPCVHAAGELRGCQQEEALARQCDPWWWRKARLAYLAYRARLQRRDYHLARGVLGLSRRFNAHVTRDYALSPDRLGVVYHPVESGVPSSEIPTARPKIRLLFVGRISVRKGVDLLLAALPNLLTGDPDLEMVIVGAGSLWSNYEPLLRQLPTERCTWRKSLSNAEVNREMQVADILLVPSSYEPGGIVVGEALANGMMIVASDEVGSAENLPRSICQEFRAGEVTGFQRAIEAAVAEVRRLGHSFRATARAVAHEQFDRTSVTVTLLREIERLLGPENAV